MSKYRMGIVGVGMVGGSLAKYFEDKKNYDLKLFDMAYPDLGEWKELEQQDFIYICVPVYFEPGVGCDLSIIMSVLSRFTTKGKVIVLKSTVTPGITDMLQHAYPEQKFMFNPEFLTEETADNDTRFPDRQILGYTKESYKYTADVMLQLPLAPYERVVPARVAEMMKYAGNVWFSIKVAHNNELYDLAESLHFSQEEWDALISGLSADKRIGRTHLSIHHKHKRGYAGKCLPKDTKQLLEFAKQNGVEMSILKATDRYNSDLLRSQGLPEYS